MCSIAGAYWVKKGGLDSVQIKHKVDDALNFLHRRGPDEASSVVVRENLVMGGNRLIIRGQKGDGSLPFRYNGNLMFYNGEIYNYKKWQTKASSDGAVILPLFNEMGIHAFKELDGEFALSIWDDKNERLLLVRDPFGTKPLYFSWNNEKLLWSSTASAINEMEAQPFCKAVKSPTYKHSYAVQEPYTSYKGIWAVPPGHLLAVDRKGPRLYCYNQWKEVARDSRDLAETFEALTHSLGSRLDYEGTIGIPMSAGVDSGIIAFMADRLGVKYHLFSVIEIFGEKTDESEDILRRIERLKNAKDVSLLKTDETAYQLALSEMFDPRYYDSEKFDNGNILMHTVFRAMHDAGIKVAVDGSGGDELFHGYKFRDDFQPVSDWPRPWTKSNYYYSLFTTLLDYTSKSDRAGAYFSIESRYPFQNVRLMKAAARLSESSILKWPLREYLLNKLDYGSPLSADQEGKFGFSIKNRNKESMIRDMKEAWMKANGLHSVPHEEPLRFPFSMGISLKNT